MTGADASGRRAAVSRFYSERRARLERLVARHVAGDRDLIEDACQLAWTNWS
jgi:hypothetical protein